MPEQRNFGEVLQRALRDIESALDALQEDELLLSEGEERIEIRGGKNGYIVVRRPSGDVVAKVVDMLTAEGRLTLSIVEFLLAKCLVNYKIVAGDKVLDSKTVPKGEKVNVFIKRVPPVLLYWTVMQILRHVPVPQQVPIWGEEEEAASSSSEDVTPIVIE